LKLKKQTIQKHPHLPLIFYQREILNAKLPEPGGGSMVEQFGLED
jgi:hypothetical protein